MPAWVSLLRLRSGAIYTGSTKNLEYRLAEHFSGEGCRTTTYDSPITLAFSEQFSTYKEALRRELQIKGWSHGKKETLICGNLNELHRLSGCRYRRR